MKRPLRVSGAAFCFAALLYGFEQSVRQDGRVRNGIPP